MMIHYLERAHREFEGNKFREVSLIFDLFISLLYLPLPLVSEILLLLKTTKFPFWTMDYSPWGSKIESIIPFSLINSSFFNPYIPPSLLLVVCFLSGPVSKNFSFLH